MGTLLQDLKYAMRTLANTPGFALGVVLTLGLGIGANVTMFSVVDRMLFRPPPLLRDPGRTHRVYFLSRYQGRESAMGGAPYARFTDLTRWTSSFSRIADYSEGDLAIGVGDDAREMRVAMVSAGFFGFFDAPPAIGRYFTPAEDTPPNGAAVAVLGYGFWQTQYGGRPDVLGATLQIGPTVYTIVGVGPRGFVGLWPNQQPVAFIPITTYGAAIMDAANSAAGSWWTEYNHHWTGVLVQRKPEVSNAQANADLTSAYLRSFALQQAALPGPSKPEGEQLSAVAASVLSERGPNESSFAKVATWVSGVAVIVFLVACANVANLLLVRSFQRRREIAIRLALGVSRGRLVRQLLTESLLLAVLGGLAGLLIAEWGGTWLRVGFLPRSAAANMLGDPRTLFFAGSVALLAGLLTGLVPALQTRRGALSNDLKSGARDGTTRRSRTRAALLVLQGALSVVLLVGAGLFVRSLQHVRDVALGFDVDPVQLVELNMRSEQLDSARLVALRHDLLVTAQATPGVERAALRLTVPLWNTWNVPLFFPDVGTIDHPFDLNAVSPDYFATMGTRLLRGRGISPQDSRTAPPVMVVSEAMARAIWPGQDPVGRCVKLITPSRPCTTVVGVAADIKSRQLGDESGQLFYLSAEQFHPQEGGLFVRTRGAAASPESIRGALQRRMPGSSYVTVTPLSEILGRETQSWELGATMFLIFGAVALALAGIGLYSVIAYGVAQRTPELGIRTALGAQFGDLIRLVLGEGLTLGVMGVLLGVALALVGSRWVAPLLFNESPHDPVVFGGVTAVLLGVAALASYIPALRATRVDPVVALRTE